MKVKFTSNLDRVVDEIRKKALAHGDKVLVERVSGIVCPVHGTTVSSIRKVGEEKKSHGFQIEGCCDQLIAAVQAGLRGS